MVKGLGIYLPMQGTWVRALVGELRPHVNNEAVSTATEPAPAGSPLHPCTVAKMRHSHQTKRVKPHLFLKLDAEQSSNAGVKRTGICPLQPPLKWCDHQSKDMSASLSSSRSLVGAL